MESKISIYIISFLIRFRLQYSKIYVCRVVISGEKKPNFYFLWLSFFHFSRTIEEVLQEDKSKIAFIYLFYKVWSTFYFVLNLISTVLFSLGKLVFFLCDFIGKNFFLTKFVVFNTSYSIDVWFMVNLINLLSRV